MTYKKAVPRSLFQTLETDGRPEEQPAQMRSEARQNVSFQDEFAPSSSPVADVISSGVLQTKASRMHSYNDHVIDYMEAAFARASELGLPIIEWLFPLQYPRIDDVKFSAIVQMVATTCEGLEEQSDDWLALKCYLCWLEACHAITDGASALYVAERMFVAGATAREFELSVRNRRDAAQGRNQNRYLKNLRQSQNERTKRNVEERRRFIAELLKKTSLTGGALDRWLVEKLAEEHSVSVSERTVRGDRKAVRS